MTEYAIMLLEGHIKALRNIVVSMRQSFPDNFNMSRIVELEKRADEEEVYLILSKGNYD